MFSKTNVPQSGIPRLKVIIRRNSGLSKVQVLSTTPADDRMCSGDPKAIRSLFTSIKSHGSVSATTVGDISQLNCCRGAGLRTPSWHPARWNKFSIWTVYSRLNKHRLRLRTDIPEQLLVERRQNSPSEWAVRWSMWTNKQWRAIRQTIEPMILFFKQMSESDVIVLFPKGVENWIEGTRGRLATDYHQTVGTGYGSLSEWC